jgi:anti-anti-sigma factor
MNVDVSKQDGVLTLKLRGRFEFNSHREFRGAYENHVADETVKSLVIDFSGVDYLDSSALGMLLLLREKLAAVNKVVALSGTHGAVKQVLEIANFSRLFSIS